MTNPTPKTVAAVRARDYDCCAWCGNPIHGERGRDWSVHHRRPRGAGGSSLDWVNLPGNLILLHGSAVIESGKTSCHGLVEQYRTDSIEDGFLVSMNGVKVAAEVEIQHAIHGLVYLHDDGTFTAAIGAVVS